jgi:hypothetical protein
VDTAKAIFDLENINVFSIVKFYNFGHQIPGIGSGSALNKNNANP